MLPSAAPSTVARLLAVAAIVVAGVCGGLIGFALFDLEVSGQEGTRGSSGAGAAVGALVGAVVAAVGVAVVAVLVLRAMTEWQTIEERTAAAAERDAPRSGRRRT